MGSLAVELGLGFGRSSNRDGGLVQRVSQFVCMCRRRRQVFRAQLAVAGLCDYSCPASFCGSLLVVLTIAWRYGNVTLQSCRG